MCTVKRICSLLMYTVLSLMPTNQTTNSKTATKAPPARRFRSLILGAALGGAVGVPAGLLHEQVVRLLPEEEQEAYRKRTVRVADIIETKGKPGQNLVFSLVVVLAFVNMFRLAC